MPPCCSRTRAKRGDPSHSNLNTQANGRCETIVVRTQGERRGSQVTHVRTRERTGRILSLSILSQAFLTSIPIPFLLFGHWASPTPKAPATPDSLSTQSLFFVTWDCHYAARPDYGLVMPRTEGDGWKRHRVRPDPGVRWDWGWAPARYSRTASPGIDALLARDRLAREGVFIWIGCNGVRELDYEGVIGA